ncbi:MAG TPA: GNAT family N-acetyltransferase, partial [Flavisolibacter sp.]|nr:GNAT family N-acetyltransferase [Flavisolibacter sp.]
PQLQIIRNSVKENILNNPSLVTLADYTSYLTVNGKGWVHLVNKHTITGFAIIDTLNYSVWALFIHPAFEKKGIGRMLQHEMLNWHFRQTDKNLWLTTAPGTRAEKFYRSSGWKQTGINKSKELIFEITKQDWLLIK